MLKVKEQELLQAYNELVAKKENGQTVVESDAVAFAQSHGYDEEKTKRFVDYVLSENPNNGLTVEEVAKLKVLGEYIEEVADELPASDELSESVSQETTAGEEVADATVGTPGVGGSVNNY